jgi:Ca2+-binding RTX toxin-like protein
MSGSDAHIPAGRRNHQPQRSFVMPQIATSGAFSALPGAAATRLFELFFGHKTIRGTDGDDYVVISRADGFAGAMGLYKVEINGEVRYMTEQELQNTTFDLGAGNDVLVVAGDVTANITANGGAGNDIMIGGAGNDRFSGGPGDDWLDGGGGTNWVYQDAPPPR